MTRGRIVAITVLALAMGFVAGAWLVGSGFAIPFLPPAARVPGVYVWRPTPPEPREPQVEREDDVAETRFPVTSSGLPPPADDADLPPSPGCTWVIEPRRFELGRLWNRNDAERVLCGYSAADPRNEGLTYLLLQTMTGHVLDLRPVFFDAEGNRYLPRRAGHGSGSGPTGAVISSRFWLGPSRQPRLSEIAYVGIENVAPDAARRLVAAAQQEARDKAMAILPPPQVGAPYVFDLPTAQGGRAASAELRNKAVVVGVFDLASRSYAEATLRKLRLANSRGDLGLVAVYFDGPDEPAGAALRQALGDETLVVVEDTPSARRVWSDGAGLDRLPKYFLIDREGVLRYVSDTPVNRMPTTIEHQVDILFGRASSTPPASSQRKSAWLGIINRRPPKPPAKTQ
jgi:hypothetical protein